MDLSGGGATIPSASCWTGRRSLRLSRSPCPFPSETVSGSQLLLRECPPLDLPRQPGGRPRAVTAGKTAVREGGEKTENGPENAGPRKKKLAICQIMQYNRGKANKGRDVESWYLPTPLCRRYDLPHSRITAPHPLYWESPLFTRGEFQSWVCVLDQGCAGSPYLHSPFIRLSGDRSGAGMLSRSRGRRWGIC